MTVQSENEQMHHDLPRYLSKTVMIVIGILVLTAIAALDWITGEDFNVSIFYAVPIGLVTWNNGRMAGLVFCFLGTLLWCFLDTLTKSVRPSLFFEIWDAGVRFAFFGVLVLALARISKALEYERRSARTDWLTSLANSRCFIDVLDSEMQRSRRYGRVFSLAYVDVDNFKQVNDRFGHAVGDTLLREIATEMQEHLRTTDTASRLGGDEFAILFPETDGETAQLVMNRLQEAIVLQLRKTGSKTTLSVGLVTFNRAPQSAEVALRTADDLMYEAKRAGKNALRFKTENTAHTQTL
jgi:diguanylate cyclase (GGDEF)-like protein